MFVPDSIYATHWSGRPSGSSAAPIDELLYNEGMTTVTTKYFGPRYNDRGRERLPVHGRISKRSYLRVRRGGIVITAASRTPTPLFSLMVSSSSRSLRALREYLRYMEKPSQNQLPKYAANHRARANQCRQR